MLNNCVFEGRLVRDPVYQTTGSGEYAQFTLAVKRSYKNSKTGEYDADYIDCILGHNPNTDCLDPYISVETSSSRKFEVENSFIHKRKNRNG